MELTFPIKELMTKNLYVISPEENMQAAKDMFETYSIHHLPVLKDDELVGILSKTDLLYFLRPIDKDSNESYINEVRLKNYKVEEVMRKRPVTLDISDNLKDALEIFTENQFHALPILSNGLLVGILTTQDILFRMLHPRKVTS